MKRISAIIFALICSISIVGREQSPPAADWQRFSPPGEAFTVEVPQKLVNTITILKDKEEKDIFAYGNYRTYFQGVYYFIFSELTNPAANNEFPALSDDIQNFIKDNSASSGSISIDGVNGTKYDFKDSENFYHTIIFLKTDKRFYTFHSIREEAFAEHTERFFKSISLHDIQGQPQEQLVEELKRNLEAAPNNNGNLNVLPNLTGEQSGGSGIGTGSGPSPVQPAQSPANQTKGLIITSKPKASYTLLARNYQITGTVMLRVTFSANRTIGAVSPVKRLPFGLTQSAMFAAKQIGFEPAIRDGVPTTVVKQVQYTFILY